jgi:hypothetical protein
MGRAVLKLAIMSSENIDPIVVCRLLQLSETLKKSELGSQNSDITHQVSHY